MTAAVRSAASNLRKHGLQRCHAMGIGLNDSIGCVGRRRGVGASAAATVLREIYSNDAGKTAATIGSPRVQWPATMPCTRVTSELVISIHSVDWIKERTHTARTPIS